MLENVGLDIIKSSIAALPVFSSFFLNIMAGNKNKPHCLSFLQPASLYSEKAVPLSKNRDASPPPSPPCQSPSLLQRQDSGPHGIKGILKKSRSTSMESDHSGGSTPEHMPARQSSVTLSHAESKEVEEEEQEEEDMEEEEEDEVSGENDKEDESLIDDITDGGSFSMDRQLSEGSSSRGSSVEMRSPSPDESLEQTSTVSEDVEDLESSLDGSQSSLLKQK